MAVHRVLAAAALAISLLVSVLVAAPASAVSYGTPLYNPSRSVPWVLSLYYSPTSDEREAEFICTASAIDSRTVVTAAHCAVGDGFYFVMIAADRAGQGSLRPIEAVVYHANFSFKRAVHDIALMRTLTPLGLPSYARLGTATLRNRIDGSRPPALAIFGWGLDQNRRDSAFLRRASLKPQFRAAKRAFGVRFRPTLMVAAGRYNKRSGTYAGACSGDSGGPLVVYRNGYPYVVGVTSFGKSGCDLRVPTVFTSVDAYRAWIAAAKTRLLVEAQEANRAGPYYYRAPSITGIVGLGQTLTCDPGSWTSNVKTLNVGWYHQGYAALLNVGTTRVITAADAGRNLVCRVTAVTDADSWSLSSPGFTVFAAPSSYLSPTLSGFPLSSYSTPLPPPGTQATCTAPRYDQPHVEVTYTWSWSSSYIGSGFVLGTGQSLVLTQDVLNAIAGRYLICTTLATNSMGTQTRETRTFMASQ